MVKIHHIKGLVVIVAEQDSNFVVNNITFRVSIYVLVTNLDTCFSVIIVVSTVTPILMMAISGVGCSTSAHNPHPASG
jgi:hypothetical protein